MIGKVVAQFKILEKLGEGGMGVVYKARDTKLDREVALKFLPTNSISTAEEKARFEQEAKAAAKLSHANIAHIYEINDHDGELFIAMEFIDGETLAELIQRGPLKLNRAVEIASQIAEGLKSAHEKGITHRDIKSANIMVAKEGQVKIMDFGLAKLSGRTMLTKEGSTLGTASYMSPEQARGESADNRSDIWALGVVLYEMISGQQPFRGEYEQAVVYGILNEDPEPLTALRSGVPLALDGIMAKALAKDVRMRYQHVDELPADLRGITLATSGISRVTPTAVARPAARSGWTGKWIFGLIPGLILGGVITWIALKGSREPQTGTTDGRTVIRSILDLSPQAPLMTVGETPLGAGQPALALSADGNLLVYVGQYGSTTGLYLRPMDRFEAEHMPGTEGAYAPFFSPKGDWIGFFSGNELKKVAVRGGQPVALCQASDAMGASWGDNDQIIFSEGQGTALFKISAQGGTPELVATDSRFAVLPQMLPGGRMALASERMAGIFAISLDGGARTPLINGGSDPHYLSSGHIVYALRGRLMAAPIDLSSLTVTGAAVPVLDHVRTEVVFGAGQFALSENGMLAYVTGAAADKGQLVWVDRKNEEEILPFDPDYFGSFSLSPDGTRVAATVSGTGSDIFVYDLQLGARSRLTRQGEGDNNDPVWSSDGKKIVFGSNRDGAFGLWIKPAEGGTTQKWETANSAHFPTGWSPDGSILAYSVRGSETKHDLWLSYRGDKTRDEVFLATPYTEWGAVFSPDDGYVAYTSDESGQSEVYVQPFPPTGEQWQVSDGGGEEPQWSRVGNELFYSKGPRWLSATFESGTKFTILSRQVIFEGPYLNVPGIGYAVAPDAQRFLVIKDSGAREVHQINIVQNWTVELQDLVQED